MEQMTIDQWIAIFHRAQKIRKIKEDISYGRFVGLSEEQIKESIIKRYDLTPAYAQNFLDDDTDPDDCRHWAL